MDDFDIVIEINGLTVKVNTDMIEENVIRERIGLKPKEQD